jgi:catechol 2,3-dioxygenase-like lactoylglutathione lyase family enzyme
MNIDQLDHVAIHVADVERSCKFYSEVLGLDPLPRPAFDFPGAWFRLGATQELHIIGQRRQPVTSHNRGNHFALRVEAIESWEAHFKSIGFEYRLKQVRPDGATQIFLTDPDGHFIELCTRPTATG